EIARIDVARPLLGNAGEVDGDLVAGDRHLHFDRHRIVGDRVVVETGLGLIDAVRYRADRGAGRFFRLIEDGRDRGVEGHDAVFLGKGDGEIATEETAGELGRDIAHQIDRQPRVVLDDAVDFLDRLALRPELD